MELRSILTFAIILYFEWGIVESRIPCEPCCKITCKPAVCTEGQVLKPKAYCNCCDLCFTELGEGERCTPIFIGGSVPFTYECEKGLHCKIVNVTDNLGICLK
ncbi:uncharacterized protein LOC108912737 [Anoplophora glabripennis]|uniref:uncharacterized protein LOC108912737 n=1 Tax=Anoplophora glabripennis TaxID=217634 RepID=UPI000874F0BD|nr:uncharacterized protein LOC108912737 [Anoplophora glabripennis]